MLTKLIKPSNPVCVCVFLSEREGRENTSNMEVSLATAVRSAPTKESPAPVVSTTFTENPLTLPLNFCTQNKKGSATQICEN